MAGKQSVFYEQKLKMKLFALSGVLRVVLQLDCCNSTHYERLSEPAGGKLGAGTAGVLWACRAAHTGTATPRRLSANVGQERQGK